jgi:hypothetical protein
MSVNNYSTEGNTVIIGGNRVGFLYPVATVIPINNIFVVRLDVPIGEIFDRNVYGISNAGKILWQIAASGRKGKVDKCYVSLVDNANGGVVVSDFWGFDYSLNMNSGEVTSKAFNRF